MKTQILRLEAHDDVISARDKMGWGQTGRIVLVWPEKGRVLNRRLDLALLQRHSLAMGAQLALVTKDVEVRYYAHQLAIPAFKNLKQAQYPLWRVSRRSRRKQFWREVLFRQRGEARTRPAESLRRPVFSVHVLSPSVRLVFFTLGVLALLAIAAVLFPEAQLGLSPEKEEQEITLDVQADSRLSSINLSGAVPAQVQSVIVEGREDTPATGSILVPDQPASGFVRFTNLTLDPVSIPKGLVVSTLDADPIRFATLEARVLPAGVGSGTSIHVIALLPGSNGNLPSHRLKAIEGILGTRLAADNFQPTSGGRERKSLAPRVEDRQTLYNRLIASLRKTALEELQKGLGQGSLLIAPSLNLVRTLEETYEPAVAQPADRLALKLRLEFQAWVVSESDLQALAGAVLEANLPDGFFPVSGSLAVDNLSAPEAGRGSTYHWKIYAHRQLQAKISEDQVIQLSLGLSPTQAKERLQDVFHLESPPTIELTPAWWPRLPVVPFRITIVKEIP